MTDMSPRDEAAVDWQQPINEVDDRLWDVLVVGAGPAGAMTAFCLSQSGHSVLLADMAAFPRPKVCGDCMISDVDENLKRLGVHDEVGKAGEELQGISIHSPSGINFDVPGRFITLRRPVLDRILARRAVEGGAVFARGKVIGIDVDNDESVKAVFKGKKGSVRARFAVIATGVHLGLARKLGVALPPKPSAIAMRCYLTSAERLNELIMCYDRNLLPGYGWIVPLGGGEFNVGCGFFLNQRRSMNLREQFARYIDEFSPVNRLMSASTSISPLRSGALRCGLEGAPPLVRNSILMTGETIGTTFPLTGEGIGQAMTSGAIAAEVIDRALSKKDRSLISDYPRRLDREVRPRHEGFKHAQRWISIPVVNNFMAKRVRESEYLRRACASFIHQSEDPRKVYSVGALLRSYFR